MSAEPASLSEFAGFGVQVQSQLRQACLQWSPLGALPSDNRVYMTTNCAAAFPEALSQMVEIQPAGENWYKVRGLVSIRPTGLSCAASVCVQRVCGAVPGVCRLASPPNHALASRERARRRNAVTQPEGKIPVFNGSSPSTNYAAARPP